ncbi:hypothetical protein UlMin_034908 [Ulmus minor]
MAKFVNLLTIALLLSFALAFAARPEPALSTHLPLNSQKSEIVGENMLDVEDVCNGIGTDDCLERRTLMAHTDYIYTQDNNP